MLTGPGRTNQTHSHALLYDRMVLRDLSGFAAPDVIEPAIADMCRVQNAIADHASGKSGGHPPQFRYRQSTIVNFDVRLLDRAVKPLGGAPSGRTLAKGTQGHFYCLCSRDLTSFITANPVGHGKNH